MARLKQDGAGAKRPPSTTVQGRENQLVAMAMDLAEKQIREGTASSQVLTHFLKQATVRDQLEKAKIEKEILEKQTRINSMESSANMEELYSKAIAALRGYSGQDDPEEDEYED